METKHTAGPLKVVRNIGVALGSDSLPYRIENKNSYTALVGTKEDAALYAAAPELLEALKNLVGVFDPENQCLYAFARDEIEAARAAIARATA